MLLGIPQVRDFGFRGVFPLAGVCAGGRALDRNSWQPHSCSKHPDTGPSKEIKNTKSKNLQKQTNKKTKPHESAPASASLAPGGVSEAFARTAEVGGREACPDKI